jgi:hypothetical protein
MRIRGLTLWLGLLGVGLVSCGSSTHALTVSWTFGGGGSCQGAGIDQVRITIPGESLQQSIFDCSLGQVLFSDFYPGNYQVTVDALDPTVQTPPTPLWTGSASVNLGNDAQARVVLQPASAANAITYLSWTFDPATGDSGQIPLCGAGQRLDSVALFVDNAATNLSYNCGDGLGQAQVVTPFLSPGNHTIQLVAYNQTEGQTAFAQTDPLSIAFTTGSATAHALTMHWQVGGMAVGWAAYQSLQTYQANQAVPCASTGIATVSVFFADPTTPSNGTQFNGFTCSSGALLDNVPAGTWLPFVAGYDSTGKNALYFQDDKNVPQQVTVVAGHFVRQQDAQTQVFVPLFPP